MHTTNRTTGEWEARIGEQFRALRIQHGLDQETVAAMASVSRGAVRSLETGAGSSLASIIKIARALDRTDWLDMLDDTGGEVSPMVLLRQQRREEKPRQRSRRKTDS
jgi:transcriptional regulator with XRE-family HTH domain